MRAYAELCKLAYDDGIKVGAQSFAVKETDTEIIIAIAGTKNFENVLEDASVWPSWTPTRSLAHAGVMNAYYELHDAVIPYVRKDKEIVFTGHSLGGGIAQIFAEEFRCKVVTFGSLKTYFRWYPAPNLDHCRVVCDDDPVPLVPGINYSQRCEAVTLKDQDRSIIDLKDHGIEVYVNRL